jgi:hypothetical protein
MPLPPVVNPPTRDDKPERCIHLDSGPCLASCYPFRYGGCKRIVRRDENGVFVLDVEKAPKCPASSI